MSETKITHERKDPLALITRDTFPKQSRVGEKVLVSFKHGEPGQLKGEVVRGDVEGPLETIVKLEDGRHVRQGEVFITYNAPAK